MSWITTPLRFFNARMDCPLLPILMTRQSITFPLPLRLQRPKNQDEVSDEGISKRTISLDDQKQLILEGKEIEEINFEGSDLEKTVTNHATNALIVKEFMENPSRTPMAFFQARPSSSACR